jgi:hypothetical protein
MPPMAAHRRHDDLLDQRGHDLAEGAADHHADGEVDDVAAHREFLELGEHSHCFSFLWLRGSGWAARRASARMQPAITPWRSAKAFHLGHVKVAGLQRGHAGGVPVNTRSPARSCIQLGEVVDDLGTFQIIWSSVPAGAPRR